jgi:multidrug efflux pump subunit AcrA (membrane-fusion protein)
LIVPIKTPGGNAPTSAPDGSPPAQPTGPARVRELETLRITRTAGTPRRSRLLLVPVGALIAAALAAGGYEVYGRTLGRPLEVQTAYVAMQRAGQPGVVLTGSGYVVTRHKYITIGTKILGQIIEEPIEEGQHVKRGELLARIDDRDYRAQLRQAIADRELADANVKLKEAQAARP